MLDWPEFVRRRLSALGLDPRREAEIITELADHHFDLFEDCRGSGLDEPEAEARVMEEVTEWRELRDEIYRAELEEDPMNHRTRCIWLPGLMTLTLAAGLLWLLEAAGVHAHIVSPTMMFSLPWTIALPVVGALGAFVSRRQGGRCGESLLAGLFPSATMSVVFVLIFPLALVIDSNIPNALRLAGFASAMLGWVIIPAAALLVGALPVSMGRRRHPTRSNTQT